MQLTHNILGWFEIPVNDMERAIRFYQKVFLNEFLRLRFGQLDMARFPANDGIAGAAGALVHYPDFYQPSSGGVLIYLSTPTGNLDDDLTRVEQAGGKVIVPRKEVSENFGYIAVIGDPEGNRIALHSRT
jgi:predicted enzyme related to lactoylglutathione lyase